MSEFPVYAYRKGYSPKPKRDDPEHRLQVQVKQYLVLCLPADVEWTSSLAGAHLGPSQRSKMKAAGLRPGFPDLVFIINRRALWIELKAEETRPKRPIANPLDDPALSTDQRRVLSRLHPEAWAVCRSLDEVIAALRGWGVQLRERA